MCSNDQVLAVLEKHSEKWDKAVNYYGKQEEEYSSVDHLLPSNTFFQTQRWCTSVGNISNHLNVFKCPMKILKLFSIHKYDTTYQIEKHLYQTCITFPKRCFFGDWKQGANSANCMHKLWIIWMLRLRDGKYRSQLLNPDMSHKVEEVGMHKSLLTVAVQERSWH